MKRAFCILMVIGISVSLYGVMQMIDYQEGDISRVWDVSEDMVVGLDHDNNLRLFDKSDPQNITHLSTIPVDDLGIVQSDGYAVIEDDYLYVMDRWIMCIIDISDPENPNILNSLTHHHGMVFYIAWTITDHVYYSYTRHEDPSGEDFSYRRMVLDLNDPMNPDFLVNSTISDPIRTLLIEDGIAYTYKNPYLKIYRINDPLHWDLIGSMVLSYEIKARFFRNDILYCSKSDYSFISIDVSDPETPVIVDEYPEQRLCSPHICDDRYILFHSNDPISLVGTTVAGEFFEVCSFSISGYGPVVCDESHLVFIMNWYGCNSGFGTFDISEIQNHNLLGSWADDYLEQYEYLGWSFTVSDHYGYIYHDELLQVVDFRDPSSPSMCASLTVNGDINDADFSGNFLYLSAGLNGISIIDITSPESPQYVNHCLYQYDIVGSVMKDDYIYSICSENLLITSYMEDPVSIDDVCTNTMDQTMSRIVDCDEILACSNSQTVVLFDIGVAESPSQLANLNGEHIVDIEYYDDYLYIIQYECIDIYDITIPTSPVLIREMTVGEDGIAYASCLHENMLLVADNFWTRIYSFSLDDPANPEPIGYYGWNYNSEDILVDDGILYSKNDYIGLSAHNLQAVGTDPEEAIQPPSFTLSNHPNPFNPTTTISFSLPEAGSTELSIYNIRGQKVKTLVRDYLDVGDHSFNWDGTDDRGTGVSSGVYLYRIRSGKLDQCSKMLLMK